MGFLADLPVIAVKSAIGYIQGVPEVEETADVLRYQRAL